MVSAPLPSSVSPQGPRTPGGPVLDMTGIVKQYPGVLALDGASLSVAAGEVHGLIGENGAGKSTIIKVLGGIVRPDAGTTTIGGTLLSRPTPRAVHELGVRIVHQELNLVPHLTVSESVFLGHEDAPRGFLRRSTMRRRAEEFLSEYLGVEVDGSRLVRDLDPAERKLVQVAHALVDGGARILVLDEPTAPLGATQIRRVFEAVDRLRRRGVSVLYVSHYLSEIQEICDRVTVLREGSTVGVVEHSDLTSSAHLIELMVGRRLGELYPARRRVADEVAPALEVEDLSVTDRFEGVDLSVRPGEIVGIAGLLGSGRNPLIDTITGLRRPSRGTVRVVGTRPRPGSRSSAADAGIALVPRDRRHSGVVLDLGVGRNLSLATLPVLSRWGVVDDRAARTRAERTAEELDIRPRSMRTLTRLLSGGNQQKVVLGRWIGTGAPVLVLEEPTVGVDIRARAEIYHLVSELAARGTAVLVSANDTDELAGIAHRVLVLNRGRVVAEVDTERTSPEELLALVTGVGTEAGVPSATAVGTATATATAAATEPRAHSATTPDTATGTGTGTVSEPGTPSTPATREGPA